MNNKNINLLIISANFYKDIAEEMLSHAKNTIDNKYNYLNYDVINIDGAFEIPAVISFAKEKYDLFLAIGCIIRGETTHYDYVAGESARALSELAIKDKLAIGNAIITCENKSQAYNRVNKSSFALKAAIDMYNIKKRFDNNL